MAKVFIIDPDDSIRHSLSLYLGARGHQVVTAAAPLDCDVFRGHRCSRDTPCGEALLTANLTSGLTGLDFIARQLAGGCRGAIRTKAVMSAAFIPEEIVRARRLGCRVFPKPVTPAEVASWLRGAAPDASRRSS